MKKGVFFNLSLFIGVFFISIFLIEVLLRISGFFHFTKFPYPKYYFVGNMNYGHDINPNFIKGMYLSGEVRFNIYSNSLGCFDKDKDMVNVIFIGDSFTFGIVPEKYRFSSVISNILNIKTLNCGVPSYGTKQTFEKINAILKYRKNLKKPSKVIIYSYFLNDFDDDIFYPSVSIIDGFPISNYFFNTKNHKIYRLNLKEIKSKYEKLKYCKYTNKIKMLDCILKDKFVIYSLIRSSVKNIYLNTFYKNKSLENTQRPYFIFSKKYRKSEYWKKHLNNIKMLNNLAKLQNKKLVVIIIPTKEQVYPELLECNRYRNYINSYYFLLKVKNNEELWEPQNEIIRFLEKEKISYINLLPILYFYSNHTKKCWLDPNNDFYYRFDGHFNINGNKITALIISKFLIRNGIIKEKSENKEKEIDELFKLYFGKPFNTQLLNSNSKNF